MLLIGTNDLEEAAAPQVIAENLTRILAALKSHDAKVPIVLCLVFPSSATKERSAETIKEVNQLYLAAGKGAGFVSLFNGKDLPSWEFRDLKTLGVMESLDGQTASSDGRYVAKNGRFSSSPRQRKGERSRSSGRRESEGLHAKMGIPRHTECRQRRLPE